jgi:hypothetical protein
LISVEASGKFEKIRADESFQQGFLSGLSA